MGIVSRQPRLQRRFVPITATRNERFEEVFNRHTLLIPSQSLPSFFLFVFASPEPELPASRATQLSNSLPWRSSAFLLCRVLLTNTSQAYSSSPSPSPSPSPSSSLSLSPFCSNWLSLCYAALRRLGVKGVEIRKPEQLLNVASLIIPGGESTTMAKLAELHNLVYSSFLPLDVAFIIVFEGFLLFVPSIYSYINATTWMGKKRFKHLAFNFV